jgi:nitrite reductase/ring-hydroxylating ferredoxin subunit
MVALRTLLDRVESMRTLDRLADPLQRAVQAVLKGKVADALHGVWLGHPLHPGIVNTTVGSWVSAGVLDAAGGNERAATILVATGTASAVPAAAAGLNDWASLSREQRRVGLVHSAGNSIALSVYVASLVARLRGRHDRGRALGFVGLAIAATSAYIGGHLSYRQAAATNQAEPWLRQIPEGWHDVCGEAELDGGAPLVARIGEVPVLAVRDGSGDVTVMIEHCGHETGPLGSGERVLIGDTECVVCPWHGSAFRLSDGAVVRGPAANGQPLLQTRILGGRVQVAVP